MIRLKFGLDEVYKMLKASGRINTNKLFVSDIEIKRIPS